ncbi:MAG TPA: MFS transporter [Rhodanobacteraceae bacterium]|nr:MFS transporter [Rhodanobacteraceae bacterium]
MGQPADDPSRDSGNTIIIGSRMKSVKPPLSRNVRLLIGMRAARSLGQGAMVAAFALYLHALGWTATAIGAVLMGALLFGTLLTIVVGPLSDRGGRRAFLLGYDALQALVAVVAMLTTTPWLLVTAAVIGGFGRGANGSAGPFAPVEQAWLAIELPMQRRGSVFSSNSAVGLIGMGVGALLAALPAWWLGHALGVDDYRLLFVLPLAGSLASFSLLWLAREPAVFVRRERPAASSHDVTRAENRLLAKLVLANSLNGLGIGLIGPLVAYWFAIKFQRGLLEIGPGIALGFLVSAAGAFLAGAIARRHGIMNTVLWMRGVGVVLLVAMPLVPWFWAAMALYIARGASNRGTGGVRQALAAGLTRVERRGLASSLQNISIQLPRAVGPAIGGALFHAGHLALPFLLGAALQLGYLILYARFFSHTRAAQVREP